MSNHTRLIAGAMSGTSGDGVDVAIVRITGRGLDMSARLVHHHHVPFDPSIRSTLFAIRDTQQLRLSDLAKLGREISLTYARAINESLSAANLRADDLSAVAAHGQTLYHGPPNTIQWFDPALVAAEVGCAVVSDFRRADCAAGGQGAPLVPYLDFVMFREIKTSRVMLNIGGIANITYLPAGATLNDVVAFDTGPGNCISDWICRTQGPFGLSWDADGAGASRGRVLHDTVTMFVQADFFKSAPPKSTDGPSMIELFAGSLKAAGQEKTPMNDQLATAAKLTAFTIQEAIASLPGPVDEVLVSGGGIRNKAIMDWLRSLLSSDVRIELLDYARLKSDAKEAVAFALLGAATLDGMPSNVPRVTGARRAVVLGSITPKP